MTHSSTNPENGSFRIRSTPSNEHLIFAETLRDWRDPLLQGYEPIPVPLCPRCSTCKCESLKDLPNTSDHSIHHHHHHGKHEVSCPNFRFQTDRAKTLSKQRLTVKAKRRATSHDPSLSLLNTSSSSSSIIKCKSAELSPVLSSIERNKYTSKIPVRVSTPTSDHSPTSSLIKDRKISSRKTQIPRLILPPRIPSSVTPTDELFEVDSLNGDIYQTPTMMSDVERATVTNTNEQVLVKNKKKHKRRSRCQKGRHSKSKQTSNELSSSNSSSSSSSLSVVPLRKKSRSYRLTSPSQVLSSFSDDSLPGELESKERRPARPRSAFASIDQSTPRSVPPSIYLIQLAKQTKSNDSSNLIRTITYVWKNLNSKNEEEERNVYPYYSVEQVPPILTRRRCSSSRNINLQRGQTDSWQNTPAAIASIITSSCESSIGSAAHLLAPSLDITSSPIPKNSHQGHVISITTIKRQHPSLLNKIPNVPGDAKPPHRYSRVQWHSDEQRENFSLRKHRLDSRTETGSSSESNHQTAPVVIQRECPTNVLQEIHTENLPIRTGSNRTDSVIPEDLILQSTMNKTPSSAVFTSQPNPLVYASTDEDVDELNSHYSEDVDRSVRTVEDYRDKLNTRLSALNTPPTGSDPRSRVFSTEYSQITFDSGVDVITEQKVYQPPPTLTIDEQSSEEITDQNDLFALSDDSLVDPKEKVSMDNAEHTTSINQTDQETFFSATSDLNHQKDIYSGYQLETVTDEEDDEHRHFERDSSNELILTSEVTATPPPPPPPIPSQFEFKLPSFGEWIDRVFTNFLTENSTNQSPLIASSRSSSIASIHNSQNTIHTSSSSQVVTVLENPNLVKDDEHSLHDMSSSSLNSEKVDFDTYIIDSNYEKINPSITNQANEIPFISERSKSFLSSITSSIENDDQEVRTNEQMANNDEDNFQREGYQYSSNSRDSLLQLDHHYINTTTSSIDDLTRANQFLSSTFHSKDSALGLSDDYLNRPPSSDLIRLDTTDHEVKKNETTTDGKMTIAEETMLDTNTLNADHSKKNVERTVSSSSSEQLIPKEKQTGMYYKAFGSSAAIHLAEQYQCEWLQADHLNSPPPTERPTEVDENHLRIVHQSETIGDNEDEFYLSPQTLHPSYSCPAFPSKLLAPSIRLRSYSLTTLDAYTHLNITHETLERIWLSLLDVAFSDKDDNELGEYKLRHIISLSDSYSNLNTSAIEKSRSHNDILSITNKPDPNSIVKNKSKSFDITSLIKQSTTMHDSVNMGLLQGADISEPFADRVLSTSIHSDLESIQSVEQELTPQEIFSLPPTCKEPLNFVFNFSRQTETDEFDFESKFDLDEKPLEISFTFDEDDLPPVIPIQDTYAELALFRPHSLSTIPSSRASQYASSVESDDPFDRERRMSKEFHLDNAEEQDRNHLSDDDHGVIGSEFSSPQSRPLSSIQSRSLSPEDEQVNEQPILYENLLAEYNHPEELLSADEYSENLKLLVPAEPFEDQQTSTIDSIVPLNQLSDELFAEQSSLRKETLSNEQAQTTLAIEHLSTIVNDIQQISRLETSLSLLPESRSSVFRNHFPVRHQNQRIEKVSDLEIVKQGKGFKIGYIDRQGTDQRVILTKRIEASPDVIERDPHVRLPYKGRRILNQMFSSVVYTNGYNTLREDQKFQRLAEDIEVPIIGTDPKHFDESDMISIDIDGPSTMLNSICESLVITQGSVYSNSAAAKAVFHQSAETSLQTSHSSNKEKIEVIDSWHDQTIINGSSTSWRSPFKPIKPTSTNPPQISFIEPSSRNADQKPLKSTRDIALSPVPLLSEKQYHTISTSPITVPQTVDRSCQYSPPTHYDQSFQCYFATMPAFTQVSSHEIPGLLKTQEEIQTNDHVTFRPLLTTLERSADSGILLDDHHRMKSNLGLQVDMKSSSSDSEDISEINPHTLTRSTLTNSYANYNTIVSPNEMDQEIVQLHRERAHVLDLLSLNWSRSNIWVELTEAKLNYIIGETDALLRSLSFDPTPVDNETIKTKMHQYEVDMAELTRQHLAVYRERLEDSKKQLDMKINHLESKKSSSASPVRHPRATFDQVPRSKRSTSFLSTSADNLTIEPMEETIASHPQLLDISFLTSQTPDQTIHRPTARYPVSNEYQYDRSSRSNDSNARSLGNLSTLEGLSKSQQDILDETDELVKDSQQLHSESASQFERARESLLSSETSIRQAQANLAASRQRPYSEKKSYLPNDVTLAELFKYEQSLAKETATTKTPNRHLYSSTES